MALTKNNLLTELPGSRFIIAVFVFVVVNFLIAALLPTRSQSLSAQVFQDKNWTTPMYGSWTWWMARGFVIEDPPPDVVLFGSSQVTAAIWAAEAHGLKVPIDCVLHPRAVVLERAIAKKLGINDPKIINCAIGGAVASDYYIISKALFEGARQPKLVIVGISPRDFIDNKLVAASSTEPFRFFSQYVNTGKLSSIAFPDIGGRLNAELEWKVNKIPVRKLHAILEERLASQQAPVAEGADGHALLGAISNSALRVHPGEWVVPPVMKELYFDNGTEYRLRFKNPFPAIYPIELSFFNQFLSDMHQKNIKVLLVIMPTQACNREILPAQFWTSYRKQIAQLASRNDADWVDLSDNPSFIHSDFLDTVHMNARGGAKLIQLLADAISKKVQIVTRLRETSNAKNNS